MNRTPSLLAPALAALLCVAAPAASAQEETALAVEPDDLDSASLDAAVYATLLPNPDVTDAATMRAAIAAALAAPDTRPKTVVPLHAPPRPAIRPVRLAPNALGQPPTMLVLDNNQRVQIHADGLPAANGPDRDPLVRVLPRAADPAAITVGARWSAEDRIEAPLLSQLAWGAHADVLTGAPPPRAGNVRRSLRITAMWDSPEDIRVGFTPGFTRGGGMAFEHYVAGLEVSTLDKTRAARWKSFVELSGEKLAFNNVVDNGTAHVAAGASYAASAGTQLDIAVSRGTTWTSSDLTSTIGLSVRF